MRNADHLQDTVRTDRKKLTKITHILTSNNQYGYRDGISTIDEISTEEQYIDQAEL